MKKKSDGNDLRPNSIPKNTWYWWLVHDRSGKLYRWIKSLIFLLILIPHYKSRGDVYTKCARFRVVTYVSVNCSIFANNWVITTKRIGVFAVSIADRVNETRSHVAQREIIAASKALIAHQAVDVGSELKPGNLSEFLREDILVELLYEPFLCVEWDLLLYGKVLLFYRPVRPCPVVDWNTNEVVEVWPTKV